MESLNEPICVDVDQVVNQWQISRSAAYALINRLNTELKKINPRAITIKGRVNKRWYDEACSICTPSPSNLCKSKAGEEQDNLETKTSSVCY
jgi:hypothetical protein